MSHVSLSRLNCYTAVLTASWLHGVMCVCLRVLGDVVEAFVVEVREPTTTAANSAAESYSVRRACRLWWSALWTREGEGLSTVANSLQSEY